MIASPALALLLVPAAWPRWALMWTLAVAVYAGCKWLTWRRTPVRQAPAWKNAAYLFAWPGLDAAGFLGERVTSRRWRCRRFEWFTAAAKLACGLVLLFAIPQMILPRDLYLVGWIGMIGIVLTLHFGIFHLLSCSWRSIGVQARPLMNRPLASTSLSEFWGRRWNTAFRDLTHRFVFRPFLTWFGPRWGILAGFVFSGAIHDLVISVPARGGYGGPTVFFGVQGAALMFERSAFGRQIGLGAGLPGRLFAIAMLVAPAGLLFHRPFVVGVVVPFMQALRAI